MHGGPLLIPRRFHGPPRSGNGGYTCGALAALLPDERCPDEHDRAWPTIEVSLRRPPPLDSAVPTREQDGWTVAADGEGVVAQARVVEDDPSPVEAVDLPTALAAEAAYVGLDRHPFAGCVVCGPDRDEGDGLRIFTGPVAGTRPGDPRVAGTWAPHPSLAEDFHAYGEAIRDASLAATWAAIDCPGGWAGGYPDTVMVLARMTARVDALPHIGERHVVVGEPRGREGRKSFTAATLYDADGRQVATAEHLWIEVDPASFA